MASINPVLKVKLLVLLLLFPVSFSFVGYVMGIQIHNQNLAIVFSVSGFCFGVVLDFFCSSRKLFTLALFYTPIPLAVFILTWWISDIFTSNKTSLLIGLFGLAIGLWLNYEMVLPYQFFKIKKRILAIVYFIFSISCLGFFMGIPILNILLGVLAGNYLSIRVMEHYQRKAYIAKSFRQGALFTSIVLLIMLIISSFSVLSDLPSSIQLAEDILLIELNPNQFYSLLIACGMVLLIIQYFITLFTSKTMLEYWMFRKNELVKTNRNNQ